MNIRFHSVKMPYVLVAYLLIQFFLNERAISQGNHYQFSKIPLITTFNTNDYRGGIQNWKIAQDKRGLIYVANNFGLLEYDGKNWRNYEIINNTRLRSVFIDHDNRIYVGGQNQFGYFQSDENGSLAFTSLYDLLPDSSKNIEDIWKITRFEDKIIFCSYLKTIVFDGNEVFELQGKFDFDLMFNVNSSYYLYSQEVGLMEMINQTAQRIPGGEVLLGSEVTAILPHSNNSLLIFQKNGSIYQFKDHQFKKWNIPIADFLIRSAINTALLLKNNTIAIGTQNSGIIVISPEGTPLQQLTKDRGLSNRTVLSLYEDQFQNLWAGLNNGLCMIELSSPFNIIDEQTGLPGTGYCGLKYKDGIYLGTSNGLFYQNANPNPITAEAKYQLIENTSGQVYNIQQIDDQLLLSHHNGAFVIENKKAKNIYDEKGTWKFEPIPGTSKILGGTYEGFITLDLEDQFPYRVEKMKDFKESSRVFQLINDTSIFMTHGYKGVFKLTTDSIQTAITNVKYYGQESGFPSDILINVFEIGNQLVFPAAYGVFNYDQYSDSFVHNQELEQLISPDIHISELEYNYNGNLFFLSNEELGYLKQNSFGEYEKHVNEFVRIRKYLSDDLENITVLDHENVLLGAKEGFIHYNPNMPYIRDQSFDVFIRKIESVTDDYHLNYNGSGPLENSYKTSFPANFASLKFTYAAPYFDGQAEITFQYKLEGFDKGWSPWSSINDKEYTNLTQGEYTFMVRAKNVFGDISEPATFKFKVFPPWYKSNLAYALYVFTAIMIFFMAMYWQSRKHKQDKEQLTLHQQKELEEKDSKIEQVSKESEAKITRLKNDKLRSEIDHKNRELATTTMHLINKNEFMLNVRDTMKELSKSESKEGIKKLIKEIDRNLAEDEGWEQFTKHFDQVHGDFLTNVKNDHPTLTPQEIKLCAYLRMNMSSKEIANLLNISVRGVEISRYRLRKKLNISRETNLVEYMMGY